MIPKVIHYCWFGRGEKSNLALKCIESWKKNCPDYKIIEWNEDNFDINLNEYTKMCYRERKFAFLSDYLRLLIIEREGGIYYDVDVEVLKPIDDLLENKAWFGFETKEYINTGIGFGAEKNNKVVRTMIAEYDGLLDGNHGTIGCPILNTQAIVKHGLKLTGEMQELDDAAVYPIDYFNPYDDPTGKLNKSSNTYSIHWYAKSWMSKKKILRSKLMKPIHRVLGKDIRKK